MADETDLFLVFWKTVSKQQNINRAALVTFTIYNYILQLSFYLELYYSFQIFFKNN